MPLLAPAFVQVNPSLVEPELIMPYAQASGAFDLIEGEEPRVKLSEGDLYVYMKRIDLRTQMAAGTAVVAKAISRWLVKSQLSCWVMTCP